MAYYRICSSCGSYLDPGEICDCQQKKKEATPRVLGMTSNMKPKSSVPTDLGKVKVKEVRNG